ncbi:MAG: glycoside hydrolase family 66 protein [Chloroflexia bacterium]
MPSDTPLIRDVVPDKATYRPGEAATITVTVDYQGDESLRGLLVLELVHMADTVRELEQSVELEANSTGDFLFTVTPPTTPLRGYGLDATLYGRDGEALAQASGALDVLERWSQAPRYGFLSDFGPDQVTGMEARCRSLVRYHLNVVQFYDWMWRHYRLLPPEEEFTDALGRNLSLRTVRAGIRGVQAGGGAAMAYGAVYGAEPEYADRHTELRLYGEAGVPISLAELFYIMNIAPGSPWVDLIVAEFAEAVRELGFDGIHLDQYGFPKTAYTASGELVDLSLHFPALIDRARAAVVAERAGAGVIFNAVENWPIETVAPTSQDAVYIEVWPPYVTYNDLRELIREGKRLGKDKQVILAAYLSPFLDESDETIEGAEAAALLATAVISASGGFHLLLGEQDGVLCDPYYPKYATMRPSFAARMRAYYDFLVRYEELFIAPDIEDWEVALGGEDGDERSRGISSRPGVLLSREARAETMWVITRSKPGYRVVHLINLTGQHDVLWNAPHSTTELIDSIELRIEDLPPVKKVLFLAPERQRALALEWTQRERSVQVQLPYCDVWAVVVYVLA